LVQLSSARALLCVSTLKCNFFPPWVRGKYL